MQNSNLFFDSDLEHLVDLNRGGGRTSLDGFACVKNFLDVRHQGEVQTHCKVLELYLFHGCRTLIAFNGLDLEHLVDLIKSRVEVLVERAVEFDSVMVSRETLNIINEKAVIFDFQARARLMLGIRFYIRFVASVAAAATQ